MIPALALLAVLLMSIAVARPAPVGAAGVVGDGTPERCTEAALDAALMGGGSIGFDCGPVPVVIAITGTKVLAADTAIDGGTRITISGADGSGSRVGVFWVGAGVTFTVRNLTIADGGTGFGGAIFNDRGTVEISRSTLSGNSARGGGAIANGGTLTVVTSTFSDNGALSSGGIANFNGATLTVANCTFAGNSDGYAAGAIANVGTLTVTNSTFFGNSSTFGAGAIGNADCGAGTPCPATLSNTIIANSVSGANCTGTVRDGGHNLDSDGACGVGAATDALLDPAGLADNGGPSQTIGLQPKSPAIGGGDSEVCAQVPVHGIDQRGFARPGSGHTQCSIGAYEADAVAPTDTATPTRTPTAPPTATPSAVPCTGDCNHDGIVAISELILGVDIVLATQSVDACPSFADADGLVDVAQLIKGVRNALNGCGIQQRLIDGARRAVTERRTPSRFPSVRIHRENVRQAR